LEFLAHGLEAAHFLGLVCEDFVEFVPEFLHP
jgi:hypothetical protein